MSEDASTCTICGERPRGRGVLCEPCAARAGLPPPGEPLRPPSPCARCACPEIVRVQMRERSGADVGEYNREVARPFALTWALGQVTRGIFNVREETVADPELKEPFGHVEAYVCRRCGATELMVREPESIPIGPEYGTELIVAPSGGSYR